MIRLPPTSISLSESDIQFHLREINIYQSLLEQGFKLQDIQRYYASNRPSVSEHAHQAAQAFTAQNEYGEYGRGKQTILASGAPAGEIEPGPKGGELESRPRHRTQQSHAAARPVVSVEQEPQREDESGIRQYGNKATAEVTGKTCIRPLRCSNSNDSFTSIPTTVELRTRAPLPTRCFQPGSCGFSESHEGKCRLLVVEAAAEFNCSHDPELSPESRNRHEGVPQQNHNVEEAPWSQSPPLVSQANLPFRHRPRQSSTLHITRNVSSPSSSGQSDDSFKSTVAELPHTDIANFAVSPRTRTMTYRPRSQTYPWVQSEADDPTDTLEPRPPLEGSPSFGPLNRESCITPRKVQQISVNKIASSASIVRPTSVTRIDPSPTGTTIVTSHRQVSTPLRVEADDFVPFKLPPPFSATRRISSDQHGLPPSTRNTSPSSFNYEILSRSSPRLAVPTPPRSSSLASTTRQFGTCLTPSPAKDFPSSPPKASIPQSSPLVGSSIQVSMTPNNRDGRRQVFQETQPRAPPRTPRTQIRNRQTDGPGPVYNDQLPADLQPRTPADLSRGILLTEREAAYTAPPGRTGRTPATISRHQLSPRHAVEPGEESPSRRARTLRERRDREHRRSAFVEDSIWNRVMEMDGDMVGTRTWNRPGPSFVTSWQDDFAADSVGEENFEAEGLMRFVREETNGRGRRQP